MDEGADLSSCINAATTPGVAPDSLVPKYQIPVETPCPGCAAARAANPLEHAVFCPDEASMLAAIEAGRPVYFGIIVTNRFNPDSHGYIGPYRGIAEGGHAVLAVGCSATADGFCYIVQNSWGKDWGAQGYCLLDSSWAQPQVYGAFALEGEKRRIPVIAEATVASPPAPTGTADRVVATYRYPGTPSPSSAAIALAGSSSSAIYLATWHLSDSGLTTALCMASTAGVHVRVAVDASGGTETRQSQCISALKSSGGTCWKCTFHNGGRRNYMVADGIYTLGGSYYYSPTAVELGTYSAGISGSNTATAAINAFNTLVSGGTLAYAPPAGGQIPCGIWYGPSAGTLTADGRPTCPANTTLADAPTPGATASPCLCKRLTEVDIGWGNFYVIWKTPRTRLLPATANNTANQPVRGPIRRIVARIRQRRR